MTASITIALLASLALALAARKRKSQPQLQPIRIVASSPSRRRPF